MARVLGVSANTIKVQIKRLKVSSDSGVPPTQRRKLGRPRLPLSDLERLNTHRESWLNQVTVNPDASRTEHRHVVPTAYNWLVKHDKEWLEENSPERRGRIYGTSLHVNWPERDREYSAATRETAAKLLTGPSRPIWVSRTAIAKNLGILAVVTKTPAKLPLTNKALDEVSESNTAFAIRRIRWAADSYRQEQVPADQWKLQTRAAVSNKIGYVPEVKAVVNECIRELREMNEAGWEYSAKGLGEEFIVKSSE